MRIALDTNVLVYAEGIDGEEKKSLSTRLLGQVRRHEPFLSVQVFGELFNVLVKRGYTRAHAHDVVAVWHGVCSVIENGSALMIEAIGLATKHRLRVWDALILDAAADASCSVLLSEDFQNGFAWRGVTVCNPFLAKPHPLIADLVRDR
jgi:predicted nucleic acid-binding protein